MNLEEQAAFVYDMIWNYLVEHDELPSIQQVAETLGWSKEVVQDCLRLLRHNNQIERTTLKPTTYNDWWRKNVRASDVMLRGGSLRLTADGRLVKRHADAD
jgi:DNA-binding FadR family transcriptional regulator